MHRLLSIFVILLVSFSGCSLMRCHPEITVNLYADTKLDQTGDNFNETILSLYPNQKDIYFLLLVDAGVRKQLFSEPKYPDSEAVFSFKLARDGSISKLKLVSSNTEDESFLESRERSILEAAPFYAAPDYEDRDPKTLPIYLVNYHF